MTSGLIAFSKPNLLFYSLLNHRSTLISFGFSSTMSCKNSHKLLVTMIVSCVMNSSICFASIRELSFSWGRGDICLFGCRVFWRIMNFFYILSHARGLGCIEFFRGRQRGVRFFVNPKGRPEKIFSPCSNY